MTTVRRRLLTKYGSLFMGFLLLFNLLIFTNFNTAMATEEVDMPISVVDEVYQHEEVDVPTSVIDEVYDEEAEPSEIENGSFTVSIAVYGLSTEDTVKLMLMDKQGNLVMEKEEQQAKEEQVVFDFDNVAPGEYILCITINGVIAGMHDIIVEDDDVDFDISLAKVTGIISGLSQGVTASVYWEPEDKMSHEIIPLTIISNGSGDHFTIKALPGTYRLRVEAEDYEDYTAELKVEKDVDLGTITMNPANDNDIPGDDTSDNGTPEDGSSDNDTPGDDTSDNDTPDSGTSEDNSQGNDSSDNNSSNSNSSSSNSGSDNDSSTNDQGTFSNNDIEQAIATTNADSIELVIPSEEKGVQLTGEQLENLANIDKPVSIIFNNNIVISFNPEAYQLDANDVLSFQITEVNNNEAQELVADTKYDLVGNIYDLNMEIKRYGSTNKLERFSEAKGVSLPVPEEFWQDVTHNSLEVFYFNEETNNWEPMNAYHDIDKQVLTFSTNHFSKYAVLKSPVINFIDIDGHWAEQEISAMAAREYVKGYQDGSFKPAANVTRAEFAVMLSRLLQLGDYEEMTFKDVTPGQWYYESIAQTYKVGIVNGYSIDEFKPNEYITREQMAAMIANALDFAQKNEIQQQGDLETFLDSSSISTWAKDSVAKVTATGIIKGLPFNGGFAFTPEKYASRAETAVMLARLNTML